MLLVIAIVSVLIALLLPSIGRARESARAAKCLSNLRQAGAGLLLYASDYDSRITLFRAEYIAGDTERWYPWALFVAGENRPVDSAGDFSWNAAIPLPTRKYVSHDAIRCPIIPGGGGIYSRGSYWSYGSYDVVLDGPRYSAKKWTFNRNESGTVQPWGQTRNTHIFDLTRVPEASEFILLADALPSYINGQIYASNLFMPQASRTQGGHNPVYFVHDNKLAALMADGHAELLTPGAAKAAPNGVTAAWDKDHKWRTLPF